MKEQVWSFHAQNTDIIQYHPGFSAPYSGPNSLDNGREMQNTESLDIMIGRRLWNGAEVHLDGMMWQGYGLSKTYGVAGFPNGEAFHVGTITPDFSLTRVFIRQTIGLGGDRETVEDDELHLAGRQDVRRITLTFGKISAKDIFDNNTYANDSRTQFMNWSLMANGAWDFPADSLGFTQGFAVELNQPEWAARFGVFQVPAGSNQLAHDWHMADAWSMALELERRWEWEEHPGAVRFLGYVTRAHMGSFAGAVDTSLASGTAADIIVTRTYRCKFGFGLNAEQEVAKDIGVFARLGWNNGQSEPWAFADVDQTASLGVSIKGGFWGRKNDTVGFAGALNGISQTHREFLALGGTGITVGDGTLTYGIEKILETYYDWQIWETVHVTLDLQFIDHPAFNSDRGPVAVIGGRLHWEF